MATFVEDIWRLLLAGTHCQSLNEVSLEEDKQQDGWNDGDERPGELEVIRLQEFPLEASETGCDRLQVIPFDRLASRAVNVAAISVLHLRSHHSPQVRKDEDHADERKDSRDGGSVAHVVVVEGLDIHELGKDV